MTRRRWAAVVSARRAISMLAVALLVTPFTAAYAKSPHENVHRPDVTCTTCHTTGRETLDRDRATARTLLVPDLEQRCTACHDEGPSHRTGIPPKKPVPAALPLSADGLITCATCHFSHGEPDPFHDFLRMDNSRGGLCLSCHDLSELQ